MAKTVTIHDPDTGVEFRATRRQFNLLHAPKGRTIILDEEGQPVKKPRKSKTDTSATTEE